MEREEMLAILTSLADGINPITGEVFGKDSPYQNWQIVKALYAALQELKNSNRKNNNDESEAKVELPKLDALAQEAYERLRQWRVYTARTQDLPIYMILSNRTLHSIAYFKPTTLQDLKSIYGMTAPKIKLYGFELIALIKDFVASDIAVEHERNQTKIQQEKPLIKKQEVNSNETLPARSFSLWTESEEKNLRKLFMEGQSINKIAQYLGRTPGAIQSRLVKLGLISP